VPVWIGGSSAAAFERAARFGHAFHAAFQPRATLEAEWAEVRRACERRGRDPGELEFSVRLYLDPGGAMDPALSIAGDPARMRETVGALEKIGVGHVLLDPVAPGGTEGRLEAVEQFLRGVGGQF
jgi:alkanesulfonate monooxygenase SsuD/methylene tetrahydromethanopterin reductase-like flavin-dependent oxidoreductase (luciferase family)